VIESPEPFGVPTEAERARMTDEFRFPLPSLPRDWRALGRDLWGRDRRTRLVRGGARARARVLGGVWLYRARLERWPLERFSEHTKAVFALATTPRMDLLASGGDDHAIRLYSLDTGRLVRAIQADTAASGDGVLSLAFSPAGDRLLSGSGRGSQIWNVDTGALERTVETWEKGVLAVAWSPRGDLVATSRRSDELVRLSDPKDGSLVHTLRGHTGDVFALAFAPTGDQLATASADGTVRIFSLTTFRQLRTLAAHDGIVLGLAWSPAGDLLASSGDDRLVKVWDPFGGKIVQVIPSSGSVRSLAFAPPGDRLYLGGDDHLVRGVAPRPGTTVWQRRETARPLALALTPSGDRLAVSLPTGEVHVWWIGSP
jgi:WD40 repeat protein